MLKNDHKYYEDLLVFTPQDFGFMCDHYWTLCIKGWTISSLVRDNSLPELYWPAKYLKRFSTHCKFTFFIWKNFKLVIFLGWNCLAFLNLSFVCYSWMLFGLILSLYVKANSIQWVRSRARLVTKRQEKTEAVSQSCSVKKLFIEISQNSQENTFARVSFLLKLLKKLLKKRLWHRCFPVNFAKFWRISFLIEHLRWPILKKYLNYVNIRIAICVS